MKINNTPFILITVDVEDWFQVENFKAYIPVSSWSTLELRVERNTHFLLDFFDSHRINSLYNHGNPQVTFFILGWVAKRLPHLVREIAARGHEVASHGFGHELCCNLSETALKADLIDSKHLMEDIAGVRVYGYRAPSFSLTDSILELIAECGYRYDSSYNSFALHNRYGRLKNLPQTKNGMAFNITDDFAELPISNLQLGKAILPWGGGGYFRLIPFPIFKLGVKQIFNTDGGLLFYTHSWEIDPYQPKINQAQWFYRFRHYTNLQQTLPRLSALIRSFPQARFVTCRNYLNIIAHSQ